jgi:riboflavin kinase/FMN adenylyltransferase
VKRIYNLYKIQRAAATIGIFDGVHRGHQRILRRLIREAKRLKRKSLVVTFYPHPRKVLNPGLKTPLLISLEHRLRLIEDMGVDFLLIIKFTKRFSQVKAEDFMDKVLIQELNIKALVVGENFLFGNREKGSLSLLKRMSRRHGFHLTSVRPVKMKKDFISSTRIRHAIERGDLKNASLMLGRPVTILGTVIRGKRVGRKLGFPTANIDPHHEAIPPKGVYNVDVRVQKKIYKKAVLNIGTRPTFGKAKEPTIELHILDFKRDIYKKDVEIIFKRRIREEKRFSSVEALREQIQRDILSLL